MNIELCNWDDRPAIVSRGHSGELVAFAKLEKNLAWQAIDALDAFHTARVMTSDAFFDYFSQRFGDLSLPVEILKKFGPSRR